jgi:hypothetical protein
METEYVRGLITEMRDKWAWIWIPLLSWTGAWARQKTKMKVDVLLVGSSNAQKLTAALLTKGNTCDVLFSAAWTNADNLAGKLRTSRGSRFLVTSLFAP